MYLLWKDSYHTIEYIFAGIRKWICHELDIYYLCYRFAQGGTMDNRNKTMFKGIINVDNSRQLQRCLNLWTKIYIVYSTSPILEMDDIGLILLSSVNKGVKYDWGFTHVTLNWWYRYAVLILLYK